MLDFEEELKKFDKSLEQNDLDDALAKADITDMNDIMLKMMKENMPNR